MGKSIFGISFFLQLTIVLTTQSNLAVAQKLPKIQTASVRAPANIKIDGKTTEWNDQFQAYNKANYIYYTLSNDDNNIYLTAHANQMMSVRKIFRGGLTFTLSLFSKDTNQISVTYPAIKMRKDGLAQLKGNPFNAYDDLKSGGVATKEKVDALIASSNDFIRKAYNEIYVTGIPGINDPFLSVYNTEDIKEGSRFDNKLEYTYELAIPLKYLVSVFGDIKRFKYDIKLNAEPIKFKKIPVPAGAVVVDEGRYLGPGSAADEFMYYTTNFSGEYTLALK